MEAELRKSIEAACPCQSCDGSGTMQTPCTKHDDGEPQLDCTCGETGEIDCPACDGTGVEPSVDLSKLQAIVQSKVRATMEADCKRVCEYCRGEVLGFDAEPVKVPNYAQPDTWWHALSEGRRWHDKCVASTIRAAMQQEGAE